jgi:putative ABC transport system ATP-binding protein
MSEPLLTVAGLTASVPGGRILFSGLSLVLARGEFVAIMGESGVGKSTLLNLIAGLDTPCAGEIDIEGARLDLLSEVERTRLRRDRIGFVFQAFHLLPYLTLAQNVALPLVLQHVARGTALVRAAELLGAVGLGSRGADYPTQLSGGEMQRVAIARALIHRPPLLLADEPTGNLDPSTAATVLKLLAEQVRETSAAAILVTHSEVAASAADRVLRLTNEGLVPR